MYHLHSYEALLWNTLKISSLSHRLLFDEHTPKSFFSVFIKFVRGNMILIGVNTLCQELSADILQQKLFSIRLNFISVFRKFCDSCNYFYVDSRLIQSIRIKAPLKFKTLKIYT